MTNDPSSNAALNVRQLLAVAAAEGLERLDAELLLLHALGKHHTQRAWLRAHDNDPLEANVALRFTQLCQRRVAGEPVAYLLGTKEFHGLELQVDARVLVPRPDTETLVNWALERLQGEPTPPVLDLGTGSGAIALAIAHARRDAMVTAVDASNEALDVARANSQRLGLEVRFVLADWLDGANAGLALIVSNPPYVAAADPHLPALRHEPLAALVAGQDGLDDIRRIVRAAPAHLRDNGWLLLEHGHDQGPRVRQMLSDRGFVDVQSRNDLAGIVRCSGGMWRTVK